MHMVHPLLQALGKGSSSGLYLCTVVVFTQSLCLQASGGRAAPSHSLGAALQQPVQLPVMRKPAGAESEPFVARAATGEVPSRAAKSETAAEGQGAAHMAEASAGAGDLPGAEAAIAASTARVRVSIKGAGPKKGKVQPKASGESATVDVLPQQLPACHQLQAPLQGPHNSNSHLWGGQSMCVCHSGIRLPMRHVHSVQHAVTSGKAASIQKKSVGNGP